MMHKLSFQFKDDCGKETVLEIDDFSDIKNNDWYDKVGDDFYKKLEKYHNKIALAENNYLQEIEKELDKLKALSIPDFNW